MWFHARQYRQQHHACKSYKPWSFLALFPRRNRQSMLNEKLGLLDILIKLNQINILQWSYMNGFSTIASTLSGAMVTLEVFPVAEYINAGYANRGIYDVRQKFFSFSLPVKVMERLATINRMTCTKTSVSQRMGRHAKVGISCIGEDLTPFILLQYILWCLHVGLLSAACAIWLVSTSKSIVISRIRSRGRVAVSTKCEIFEKYIIIWNLTTLFLSRYLTLIYLYNRRLQQCTGSPRNFSNESDFLFNLKPEMVRKCFCVWTTNLTANSYV